MKSVQENVRTPVPFNSAESSAGAEQKTSRRRDDGFLWGLGWGSRGTTGHESSATRCLRAAGGGYVRRHAETSLSETKTARRYRKRSVARLTAEQKRYEKFT